MSNWFKDTAWLAADRFGRGFAQIALVLLAVRVFGAGGYGSVAHALAVASICGVTATLGADTFFISTFLARPEWRRSMMSVVVLIRLIGGALSTVLAALYCALVSLPWEEASIVLAASALFACRAGDAYDLALQSMGRFRDLSVIKIISFLFAGPAQFVAIWIYESELWFVLCMLLEPLVALLMYLVYFRRSETQGPSWPVHADQLQFVAKHVPPLVISTVAVLARGRLDQILIRIMLGGEALGVYAAGIRLIEACATFAPLLSQALLPRLSKHHVSGDRSAFEAQAVLALRLMFAMALAAYLPFLLVATQIVDGIMGSEYSALSPLLPFMALRLFPSNWTPVRTPILAIEGRWEYSAYCNVVAACISVAICATCLRVFGLPAAVAADLVACLVAGGGLDIAVRLEGQWPTVVRTAAGFKRV